MKWMSASALSCTVPDVEAVNIITSMDPRGGLILMQLAVADNQALESSKADIEALL